MSEDRRWNAEAQKWGDPAREALRTAAIDAIKLLTDAERVNVMSEFCMHCGNDDPECVCMKND